MHCLKISLGVGSGRKALRGREQRDGDQTYHSSHSKPGGKIKENHLHRCPFGGHGNNFLALLVLVLCVIITGTMHLDGFFFWHPCVGQEQGVSDLSNHDTGRGNWVEDGIISNHPTSIPGKSGLLSAVIQYKQPAEWLVLLHRGVREQRHFPRAVMHAVFLHHGFDGLSRRWAHTP